MSNLKVFEITHQIDGVTYGNHWTAKSWEEAEAVAKLVGGHISGEVVCAMPTIPSAEILDYIQRDCALTPIAYHPSAAERLEAFLAIEGETAVKMISQKRDDQDD